MKEYDDGQKAMEIKLYNIRVPNGVAVSAVIDETTIGEVMVNQGRSPLLLRTDRGERVPQVNNGSAAEIQFLGDVLVRGAL